ncbi:PaaI family thioesterase [Sphingomicrobium arenosum]|uniref:PaaI family thioesterase n=1 Tax=Sphingomicrobium arenosum TaxID=2233861 RepID=UPI0022403EE9|nr:PaaI family thioesterase [Sphingomicrobium arenosum]
MDDSEKRRLMQERADLLANFDIAQFLRLIGSVGHGKALGYDYVDHGDNWVELGLSPKPELVGVPEDGILASGAIVGLLDTCGGASVWQALGKFEPIVTIDLRLDYLRPATIEDRIIARCETYKLTRSVAFVRGIARLEDGRELAHVAGTFMVKA